MASIVTPEVAAKVAAIADRVPRRNNGWQALEVINVVSSSAPDSTLFARQADAAWFASGARPEKDTFIVTAQTKLKMRALRLEVLPDQRLPHGGPGRFDNGNFHLSRFRASAQPAVGETKGAVSLEFARASADHADAGDVVANALDDKPESFWSIHPRYNESHEAVFVLKESVGFDAGTTLTILLDFMGKSGHQISFRLCATTAPRE